MIEIVDGDGDQLSVSEFSANELCISVYEIEPAPSKDPRTVVLDRERVTKLVEALQDWMAGQ